MAFDPGFTDYRAEPNGGYTFAHPDGRQLFFHGPEADRIAQDIDRTRPADMRTAGLGNTGLGFGPASAGTADAIRGFSEQPPAREAPQAHAAPAPVSDPRDMGPTTAPSPNDVPPPAPVAGPVPAVVEGQQVNLNAAGYPVGPNGDPFIPQTLTPPQRKSYAARAAGFAPTAKAETVEDAKRYSPELKDAFGKVHQEQQQAIVSGLQAQRAAYDVQAADVTAELSRLEAEAIKRADDKRIAQEAGVRARANLDQLNQEASDAKIDGGSIWGNGSGKDAAGGMLTLISAALTSMGSVILGRGPSGMDVINNRIAQDVAAQRAEVQRKGLRANNALAQYQRVFGDLDTAEIALKGVQQKQVATMALKHAALTGDAEAQNKAMQLSAAADQKFLEHAQQLEEREQGKVIQKLDAKYDPGSRGGLESQEAYDARVDKWADSVAKRAGVNAKVRSGGTDAGPRDQLKEQQDRLGRRLRLEDGTYVHAPNDDIYKKAIKVIPAAADIKLYSTRMEDILNKPFSSWSPNERGQYMTWSGEMKETVKTLKDLGASITGPETSMIESYTNENALDKLATPMAVEEARARLRAVRQVADRLNERPMRELYMDPQATVPYQSTKAEQQFNPGATAPIAKSE